MANTLLTPTIVAKEALIALENELVLANLVHRDYTSEFKNVGATVQVRVPTTFTATSFSSSADATITVQDVTESTVNVVLNHLMDVSFEIRERELSLDIVDFSEQTIQPAMRAQAQEVDAYLAGLYADVAGHYPVSGTPAVSDITGVRAVLNVNKVPMSERRLVMHPVTEADYLSKDAFLHAEKRGDTRAIRDASMGRVLGFDCYMDQNIDTHTLEDSLAGTVAVAMLGASTVGAKSCTIDGLASGATIVAGDVFKVTGFDEWFVCAGTTATVGTAVLTFEPAMKSIMANNAVVTFQANHRANLAFHKNAFALVTAPLAMPLGGANGAVLNYKGISCRVVYDYSTLYKKNMISIDMLYGVKTLDENLAARLCDAR